MAMSLLEVTENLKDILSREDKYYLSAQFLNKDVLTQPVEDGYVGIMFPIGCVNSYEEAEKLQAKVSARTGSPVTIVKSGSYVPLYVNTKSVTYIYDPTKSFEDIEKEILKQKQRNDKIITSNKGLEGNKQFKKIFAELQEKLDAVQKNSNLSTNDKEIIRLYYSQQIQELKRRVSNLEIDNDALEKFDKNSLSYLIYHAYQHASHAEQAKEHTELSQTSLHKVKKHSVDNSWLPKARERLTRRGEENLYLLIEKYFC